MRLIKPFHGLRPQSNLANSVIAPPYDVLSSAEAKAMAAGNALSFLHVSKPEIDLPSDIDVYSNAVYEQGKKNFFKLINDGVLSFDADASYYIYRIKTSDHEQTGLVAAASVAAYDENLIKKHEFTRPKKENDRVAHIEALQAQTGPVLLAYRNQREISTVISEQTQHAPCVQVTDPYGYEHMLWQVSTDEKIKAIDEAFAAVNSLYIADGHHRSQAASRVAHQFRENGAADDHISQSFLSVIFPDDQMHILPYNRVIRDLNGLSGADFIEKLEAQFIVEQSAEPVQPTAVAQFGLYFDESWYHLTLREPKHADGSTPVETLSVSILAKHVIEPIFGITDPRNDDRIDFVGGSRGLDGLQARVDSNEMKVAFSLAPTPLSALFDVADANAVMPPKSTWFEPKLVDGLVSLCFFDRKS